MTKIDDEMTMLNFVITKCQYVEYVFGINVLNVC